MHSQPIDIQILGYTLRVSCPSSQEKNLKKSVFELEKRLKDLKTKTGVSKIENLVFIVALNMCHEFSQERIKIQDYIQNMEKKIISLKETIDQILAEQKNVKSCITNILK